MDRRIKLAISLALVTALLAVGTVWADTLAGYELSWWTVDAGGQTFSSGGSYTLGGTAGQADAGVLSGGGYTLGGGFWGGGGPAVDHRVYLPLVLR